jgi:membrane protein
MKWLSLAKETFGEFGQDDGPSLAAALSYYAVFSLPPLLILLMTILGAVLDPADVQKLVTGQIGAALGPGAAQLREILANVQRPGNNGGLAGLVGIGGLLFGATGAFIQLQSALNRIWEVRPDPARSDVRTFFTKRLLSFGMLLTIGFLLLVSLVLSALLEAFGDVITGMLPGAFSGFLLRVITDGISLLVIAGLFALMFRYVPDARVSWTDARVGALVTAVLFTIGKLALSLYLGRSDPGSAFGAAGALALLLVWIYYSAIILFMGAEFTEVWARRHGRTIEPERGAVRVVREFRPANSVPRGAAKDQPAVGGGRSVVQQVPTQQAVDEAAGVPRRRV